MVSSELQLPKPVFHQVISPMNDATRTSLTYGLGAEYNVNHNIGMRLGWDHYSAAIKELGNHENNVNANVVTVGAVYHF